MISAHYVALYLFIYQAFYFTIFSDLKLTEMETSYFASLTQLGFPIGGLMSSLMASMMGKRLSSLFGQALSYILGKFALFYITY